MSGLHSNDDPVELHDQQLAFPEHRFMEHVAENEQERQRRNVLLNAPPPRVLPVLSLNEVFVGESLSSRYVWHVALQTFYLDHTKTVKPESNNKKMDGFTLAHILNYFGCIFIKPTPAFGTALKNHLQILPLLVEHVLPPPFSVNYVT